MSTSGTCGLGPRCPAGACRGDVGWPGGGL